MTIHWDSLLAVFAASLGSTVAVVVLVTVALLGLSARSAGTTGRSRQPLRGRPWPWSAWPPRLPSCCSASG